MPTKDKERGNKRRGAPHPDPDPEHDFGYGGDMEHDDADEVQDEGQKGGHPRNKPQGEQRRRG